MKRTYLGLGFGLLFLLVPMHLTAQQGLFLGGYLNGTAFSPDAIDEIDEDSETESGYGFSGIAGYSFGAIAPFAKLSWATMSGDEDGNDDGPALVHLDVGARLSLPLAALVPYINAAYTFQQIRQDFQGETYKVKGSGITGGVGLQILFGQIALEAALNVTSGKFTEVEYGDQSMDIEEADNTTTRFDLGVVFFTGGNDDR